MNRIENDKIVGEELRSAQFLNGSPDCKDYQVKVVLDGADINEIVKHAINAGLIVLRKRIRTKAQADALANGITFAEMVSAKAPADPNVIASSIDVDKLDPEVEKALLAKLLARQNQE